MFLRIRHGIESIVLIIVDVFFIINEYLLIHERRALITRAVVNCILEGIKLMGLLLKHFALLRLRALDGAGLQKVTI